MSYPRVDSRPAPSPSQALSPAQADVDEASRRRAIDALYRAITRLAGDGGRDWRHCGKAACLRSRRCRGHACEDLAREPETSADAA